MKPVIHSEADTIKTSDITTNHIVVAVINKTPTVLYHGCFEQPKHSAFHVLSRGFEGNAYSYYDADNTPQKMVERAIGYGAEVALYAQSDWKQALQWLIDNA